MAIEMKYIKYQCYYCWKTEDNIILLESATEISPAKYVCTKCLAAHHPEAYDAIYGDGGLIHFDNAGGEEDNDDEIEEA